MNHFYRNALDALVVEWIRIHMPMQGIQVQPLIQEDPTCRQGATKPKHHNY